MTTNSSGGTSWTRNPWVWVAVGVAAVVVILFIVVNSGGGDDEAQATTTLPTSTTTTEATTTTAAPTTTVAPTTTEPEIPVVDVPPTAVTAVLDAYNDEGAALFPPGSVEANWYQWNGYYVVLYRGWDAFTNDPICAGNSLHDGNGFNFVTSSPYNGTMDDVCSGGSPAPSDRGVQACGGLLYYVTEIPVGEPGGTLYGSLEFNDGSAWAGQTSQAALDDAGTPEFQPFELDYQLPPSEFDELSVVSCGE